MAVEGEGEEVEYESDSDDALRPSTMRRRVASDDEDGDGSDGGGIPTRRDPTVGIGSDGESDGQGGAPGDEDEDEEEFDAEGDEEYLEEEAVDDIQQEGEEVIDERANVEKDGDASGVRPAADSRETVDAQPENYEASNQAEDGEGKDDNQPFVVPKAGAFYMHDDRFRENSRGRPRRMLGARKSWESKDDRAWVHDRFEEMNLHDVRNDKQRRITKGRFRGHGVTRNRGNGGGYVRGNNLKSFDDTNNQRRPSRSMRGRGPMRYESLPKNNSDIPATQNKQYTKSRESTSSASATVERQPPHISNVQPDRVLPRNHVFASSLNSASPPFYPSVSSNMDISVSQKRDIQTQSSLSNRSHYHVRPQGRGLTINGTMDHQLAASLSQITSLSTQAQTPSLPQRPIQIPAQLRVATQKMAQHPGNGTRASSPHQDPSANLSDVEETGLSIAASNYNAGKGKTSNQGGSNRSHFIYSSKAQVLGAAGAMGLSHGDQIFPATPALLPVMQFGGQHHGGHGMPTMGMALPGYVAQPQHDFGNSEMSWIPVLSGAAGALGASYCSPYIALDSSFYARASGQTSSSTSSSREVDVTKPAIIRKVQEETDLAGTADDEFSQRQNKPRRYSEMNFGR